jgi:hypothetical protein
MYVILMIMIGKYIIPLLKDYQLLLLIIIIGAEQHNNTMIVAITIYPNLPVV